MENRGRGKRLSTLVTAPASSSTAAKDAAPAAPPEVVEKKKPGRKPLAATARKRSRSPAAAPKRKQSPGRRASPTRRVSPARKASPVRKPSPARKASPGRKPKAAAAATAPVAKTADPFKPSPEEVRRSERIRASEEKVDQVLSSLAKKNPVDKRLSVIMDDVEVSEFMSGKQNSPAKSLTPNTSRRSNAITPTTTERSRATLSRSLSVALEDYSDQEDEGDFQSFHRTVDNNGVAESKFFAHRSVSKPAVPSESAEFGGSLGAAALLLLIPLFIFTTNHFCSGAAHRDCRFVLPKNWDEFATLSTYVNREIGTFYGLLVLGVALLTGLPIGKQVTLVDANHIKRTHTFNGLLVALLTGLGVFVAEYCYKYPLLSVVSRGYNHLLVLSLLTALVVAVLAFLKSRSADDVLCNPYAKTGNFLTDYFAGRETHPLVLNVFNLKLVTYHVALVLSLLFNSIILYRNLHFATLPETLLQAPVHERLLFAVTNLTCEVAPVVAAGLTILYLLDLLTYEHHLAASFELQHQGFGAEMLLRYAAFPFVLTLLPKYVAAHKFADVPLWALGGCVAVALVGLFLKRSSMRIKYLYRLDPLGELACLETYPTYQGRRLLAAKLWRLVRQPNYLGDILQNVALLPLLYWRFAWPPLLAVLYTVTILMYRARRLNERNARKYDSTWNRYCNTVRHMIVPRVY